MGMIRKWHHRSRKRVQESGLTIPEDRTPYRIRRTQG